MQLTTVYHSQLLAVYQLPVVYHVPDVQLLVWRIDENVAFAKHLL